ncbi:MAG: hypothetical protein J5750_02285 [Clostridiales bacterium]|nr:hypothetical protein [Clostridiales bacterium]
MDYELLKKIYDIEDFVGYTDEEIAEMTEGFDAVPAALSGFWKTCGNTSGLFRESNDPWLTLEYRRKWSWMKKEPRDYFYLLNENQGVYQVAIRREDMAKDDPPVYVVESGRDGAVHEVGQAAPGVSAFVMGMMLYEACLGHFGYPREDIIWYEPEDIGKIETLLKKYPYSVTNWYSERIDLYTVTGEELLFIMKGDSPSGTYSAKTKESYDRIDDLIGEIGEM